MQEKLVSIILPVYNGAANLKESIESVLNQTYKNFELIVVNDCSTDDTEMLVRKYQEQDDRVKLVNNEVNLKLPRSLNRGFDEASGEYYTWTSDDNKFLPSAIERMVQTLEENEDVDMVYTDYQKIDVCGNVIEEHCAEELEWICCTNPIGACFLYTRKIAQNVGKYNPDMFLAEDYDYWIRILRAGKVYFLKENLYQYRIHGGSLSATRKRDIGLQAYKVTEQNFVFLYEYAVAKGKKQIFFESLERRLGEDAPLELEQIRRQLHPLYKICKAYGWGKQCYYSILGKIKSKVKL